MADAVTGLDAVYDIAVSTVDGMGSVSCLD